MPILPIDLQVQFAQLGNLGKIVSQGEVAAHHQSVVAGEHVDNMSEIIDHTVTEADQMPDESSTITGDGSNPSYAGSNQNNEEEKAEENKEKNEINFEPDLGNIIDIRE